MRPGPAVTAMPSMSASVRPARQSASSTAAESSATCRRLAISGTMPPYFSWNASWLVDTFESTVRPSRTTAVAVSSHDVSIPSRSIRAIRPCARTGSCERAAAAGFAGAPARRRRKRLAVDWRYLALATAGASAFIDMYATQPLLPELRTTFNSSEGAVGLTITAITVSCALAAPFVGSLADRIGRKRVIVSAIALLGLVTMGTASAATLPVLIGWRFAQGLFMPAIFAVTLAYIAEEFPAEIGGRAVGAYMGGNVFGGFFGRYFTALVADRTDWHIAFVVLGVLNLCGAAMVWVALPRSQRFVRNTSFGSALRAIVSFVRDPVLLATDLIGGSVLFTQVATF